MAFVHHCTTCHKQILAAKVCNFCHLTKFMRNFLPFYFDFPGLLCTFAVQMLRSCVL